MSTSHVSLNGTQRGPVRTTHQGFPAGHLLERLSIWHQRALQRRELRQTLDMPEHFFKDIGVGRDEIYRECRKPFWRR